MAGDWTDWADGSDLAGMSRSGNVLGAMGYDPDEVKTNAAQREEVEGKLSSPYSAGAGDQSRAAAQAVEIAQAPQASSQGGQVDPRFAVPEGEPPNPTLKQRPTAATAPAAKPAAAPQPLPQGFTDTVAQGTGQGSQTPAAAGAAPPAATADPAAQAAPSSPWANYAQRALEGELSIADQNRAAYEGMPASPDTSTLDTRIEAESIPTNPRAVDPVTGKPLYKPGVGTRILRGIEAFGQGGLPAVFDPARAGATPYGAPTSAYGEDEQLRQGMLANDQQKRADLMARFKAASDAIAARAKGLQTVAPDYQHAGATAVDTQKALTDEEKEQNRAREATPAAQAAVQSAKQAAKYDAWDKEATRLGLRGQQAIFYRANGKLYDPRQASAEEIARAQALAAWYRSHPGAEPTLDDFNTINAAAGGRMKEENDEATPPDAVQAAANAAMGDITAYTNGWQRMPNGNYRTTTPGKFDIITGNDYDAHVTKMRQDANGKLAKTGWMIDDRGQLVKTPQAAARASLRPQPAPEGTRRQAPNGSIEVKRGGKWVPESGRPAGL